MIWQTTIRLMLFFFASSDVIFTLVKLLHGDDIISFLANDFMMMIADLRTIANPKLTTLWIDLYPALLPVSCYGPAFMKFHELFMEDDSRLLSTHTFDAAHILKKLVLENTSCSLRWLNHHINQWSMVGPLVQSYQRKIQCQKWETCHHLSTTHHCPLPEPPGKDSEQSVPNRHDTIAWRVREPKFNCRTLLPT